MKRTSGWLILLANVLVAVAVVAVLIRPAASVGDDLVVRRNNGVAKAVDRLEKALQTEAPGSVDANPFSRPNTTVVATPASANSGISMVGWVLLNGEDYGLVHTQNGEQYVQVGDVVAGWRIAKVSANSITVTKGDQKEEVKLK